MGIKVFFNNSCNICRFEINHYKKVSDSPSRILAKIEFPEVELGI